MWNITPRLSRNNPAPAGYRLKISQFDLNL
jgi:hypothetical protein